MRLMVFLIPIACVLWCAWMFHYAVVMAFPWNLIMSILWIGVALWNAQIAWHNRPRKSSNG